MVLVSVVGCPSTKAESQDESQCPESQTNHRNPARPLPVAVRQVLTVQGPAVLEALEHSESEFVSSFEFRVSDLWWESAPRGKHCEEIA